MSDSDLVPVRVIARQPLIDFVVIDSDFRTRAHGTGRLHADLPVGIYELRAIAGDQHHTEIIVLREGRPYLCDPFELQIHTTTPQNGPAAEIASTLSTELVAVADTQHSGLVVVLLGAYQDQVTVLDATSQIVSPRAEWRATDDGDCVAWGRTLPPGGHLVRCQTGELTDDLPVWLPVGYQTLVFIPCNEDGPDIGGAIVHLCPLEVPWHPEHDRDVLLELLLRRLQAHRPSLPDGLLTSVKRWQEAPMLLLAAAAVTVGTTHPDATSLSHAAERTLPEYPDTAALGWTAGRSEPVSWPPLFAAVYWRALLPADQAGRRAISPGSRLAREAIGLNWLGPYVTQMTEAPDVSTWASTCLAPLTAIEDHPIGAAVKRGDLARVAEQAGVPLLVAKSAIALLRTRSLENQRDDWRAFSRFLAEAPENDVVTVPGELAWPLTHSTVRLRCDWDPSSAVARMITINGRLPDLFSLLLSRPDHQQWLVQFNEGVGAWPSGERESYRISVPGIEQMGDHLAYEALSLEPEVLATFSTDREPIRRTTTVAKGSLRLATFERTDHDLELTVRSEDRQDEGQFALINLREAGSPDEELAVPLMWLRSQGEASGALRVGRPRSGAAVFVVPELQPAARLRLDTVRRSLDRAANTATARALRALRDRLEDEDR